MADIVTSLFGLTPTQQLAEQNATQRNYDLGAMIGAAGVNPYDPFINANAEIQRQASLAALGGKAVRGIAGLFGVQDKELKRASDLERILGETQQEVGADPTMLYPALQQKLAQAGYTREAMQVGQVGAKEIQDARLSQAKLLTEEAQYAKATQEKLDPLVRLQNAYDAALASGQTEKAAQIKSVIDKQGYIAEKVVTPETEAERDILNKYKQLYPDNPDLASKAFLEYKSTLKQKEAAAGVPSSQTPAIDISRLDNSWKEFVQPSKEKLGSINEALKLAEQALSNPQAGVQLNALLSSLYQGGRLSNQDINRTSNAGSLPAQVIQNFNKIISGTDTETNISDKVKLLRALQEGTAKSLNDSVDAWSDRWQTAPGVSKETIDTYTKGAKFRKKESTKPKTADEYLKGL